MDNAISKFEVEILERVTRIETKIDSYNNLREKLDRTSSRTDICTENIEGLRRNINKAVWLSVGALFTTTGAVVAGVILGLFNKLIGG